jgi:membrane-bound lytic murein transglycosylase B
MTTSKPPSLFSFFTHRPYMILAVCGICSVSTIAFILYEDSMSASGVVASVRGNGTVASVLGDTSKLHATAKVFIPVAEQLLAQGADVKFVTQLLNNENATYYEKLTKINIALKPLDDTKPHPPSKAYDYGYDDVAVKKSSVFLLLNDSLLTAVERVYNVPKEAVTAIMWIETRFGDFLGSYHVPSVYLSYAMATQADCIQKNKDRLRTEFDGTDEEWKLIETKIEEKAQRKASWAIAELLAMQKMMPLSPISIMNLRGSWAGAFGLAQFLPSSYLKIGVDGNNDGKINLFDVPDAAHSVGRYLKLGGWGKSKRAQHGAVYSYNHSEAYVGAVLGLAERLAVSKKLDTTPRKDVEKSLSVNRAP